MTNSDQEPAAVKPVKLAKVCNVPLLFVLYVTAFLSSLDMWGLIKIARCFTTERFELDIMIEHVCLKHDRRRFSFDEKFWLEFPEIFSDEWNSIFRNIRKRGQHREVYPNFRKFRTENFRSIWYSVEWFAFRKLVNSWISWNFPKKFSSVPFVPVFQIFGIFRWTQSTLKLPQWWGIFDLSQTKHVKHGGQKQIRRAIPRVTFNR